VTVDAFPDNVAVIVPALKLPDASLYTIVDGVLAFVAFDVNVTVVLPDWFEVNEPEPEIPLPDEDNVSVPLLTTGRSEVNAMVPVAVGRVSVFYGDAVAMILVAPDD
jgi:hypothetical protein